LENSLEILKELFMKQKVLTIKEVMHDIQATTRMTAYKYMRQIDYLSSYTHAGRYYTLKNIPEFDKDGLWHFGDIGFSRYGTLMDTIVHLINHSKSGKTNSDLEKQQRIYVQNALLSLVKDKKISREQQDGVYVYFSADPETSRRQMKKRNEKGYRQRLPEWIVAEILIEIIRFLAGRPDIDEIAMRLSKRGSLITRAQVEQVFEEHDLKKKLRIKCYSVFANMP
jgi:hypothetical protein